MTRLIKPEFHAWAYDDLLTNTTRGVPAEYIVATALGILNTKRVEWHSHDLDVDIDGVKVGVEVKSAAYVQSVEADPAFRDRVRHRPRKGLGRTHQHVCAQCKAKRRRVRVLPAERRDWRARRSARRRAMDVLCPAYQ